MLRQTEILDNIGETIAMTVKITKQYHLFDNLSALQTHVPRVISRISFRDNSETFII